MIRLFHTYAPEGFEENTILQLLGFLIFFYRPGKMDQPLSASQRCEAAISIIRELLPYLPAGSPNRSKILDDMLHLSYQRDALRFMIEQSDVIDDRVERSFLHEQIRKRLWRRDPQSLKELMRKLSNWHLVVQPTFLGSRPETPTALAMYQAGSFFAWRDILVELGTEMREFARKELEAGVLSVQGWDEETLVSLFEVEDWGMDDCKEHNICDRCGSKGIPGWPVVDLAFQRYMRRVRMDRTVSGIKEIQIVLNPVFENKANGKEFVPVVQMAGMEKNEYLPYRFVCAGECGDGVVVAWMFEGDGVNEPNLPSFPVRRWVELVEDDYPLIRMPGAFVVE
jgi:hypothetical protein